MNRVKEFLMGAGMSQKELAVLVGVSRPTVSEWVNGKKDPKGANLHRLAEVFNVEWQAIVPEEIAPDRVSAATAAGMAAMEAALYGEAHDLTEAEIADVLDYIRFKKAKRNS